MTLRSDIERAMREHTLTSPLSTVLPPNRNQMGRPPRSIDLQDPEVAAALSAPGLPARLKMLASDPEADPETQALLHEFMTDARQFARAERGDRALPGEYNGDDSQPYLPMPFAARDEHRPDRQPGSEAHRVMKAAMDQLDADQITTGLAEKLNTRSQVAAVEAREDAAEPSLRERVAAAFEVHTGEAE